MTPQDALFLLHIKSFINDAPDHRQWLSRLAQRWPGIQPDIDSWIEGQNLPGLKIQSRIMDAIWTHCCDCKCRES